MISQVSFIFGPLTKYIGAVAFPFIAAGVLYYVTRPIVLFLERYKVPRFLAILTVFGIIIFVVYLISTFIAPIAQSQFTKLIDNWPAMVQEVEYLVSIWQSNQSILPDQVTTTLEDMQDKLFANLQDLAVNATSIIVTAISSIVQFLFLLVLVPFFLFYMLKDGEKLKPFLMQFFKERKAQSFGRLLNGIDSTLSAFIQGQMLVSVCVGILLYIGYLIVGLPYALSLALFGMITNVIPFAGPYLAVIPALLVAMFQNPLTIVWVIVIMIIAQQIEGNLISPNVMGKALSLHPLTIITLILAAGSIAGFIGLLFVIPFYAVVKTIVVHFYREWLNEPEI